MFDHFAFIITTFALMMVNRDCKMFLQHLAILDSYNAQWDRMLWSSIVFVCLQLIGVFYVYADLITIRIENVWHIIHERYMIG